MIYLQNGKTVEPVNPEPTTAMPEILLIGVNHKTAPVELREKLSLSSSEIDRALESFQAFQFISTSIFLKSKVIWGQKVIWGHFFNLDISSSKLLCNEAIILFCPSRCLKRLRS